MTYGESLDEYLGWLHVSSLCSRRLRLTFESRTHRDPEHANFGLLLSATTFLIFDKQRKQKYDNEEHFLENQVAVINLPQLNILC